MISELRAERASILEAMIALERIAQAHEKRRGRPPKWMSDGELSYAGVRRVRTRVFSAETRKRMALAQQKRWAARRKVEAR